MGVMGVIALLFSVFYVRMECVLGALCGWNLTFCRFFALPAAGIRCRDGAKKGHTVFGDGMPCCTADGVAGIRIRACPGGGTCFSCRLPRRAG